VLDDWCAAIRTSRVIAIEDGNDAGLAEAVSQTK